MKNHKHVLRLTFTALFAAIIMLSTMAIAIPVGGGAYINAGDAVIYTASWFLGPLAGVASGIGSALADLLVPGAQIYAIATLIIKGLMGLVVGILIKRKDKKILPKILAMFLGALIMVVGYTFYEYFILGYGKAAFAYVPWNILQGAVGVVAGFLIVSALSKINAVDGFADKLKG